MFFNFLFDFCGRWRNKMHEMNYPLFSNYRSIYRQKRCWSAKVETDVYLYRWSTYGNIDRYCRLMVLYCANIIKNKDVNNLGTNTSQTILFWHNNQWQKYKLNISIKSTWLWPMGKVGLATTKQVWLRQSQICLPTYLPTYGDLACVAVISF